MRVDDQSAGQAAIQATPAGQTVLVGPGVMAPVLDTVRQGRNGWLSRLLQNRKALAGALILLLFVTTALLAPVLAPGDPTDFVARPHQPPSRAHLLGTTGSGQDVLDQTIWGARFSLGIGLLTGLLTTVVGVVIGMVAGYFRGRIDDLLSLVMNVFLIIPSLPLLVTLAAFLGSGRAAYFVFVLTLTGWAWPARVLRSQTLSLREKDFVSAAVVSGERSPRVIFREILPNMLSIIVGSFFGSTIYAIGAQSGLEFLGLGNPSVVSWGTNLYWAGNNAGLLTGAWWTFVPAGTCIALVAFAFALVNYAIDELTNPRLRAQREAGHVLKQRSLRVSGSRATPVVRVA